MTWAELLPALDAAAAAIPNESTGLSPSMIDYGFEMRLEFDWNQQLEPRTPREKLNQGEAAEWLKWISSALDYAKESIKRSQEQQRVEANQHRLEVDFDVGDKVYIRRGAWRTTRPSDKLENPMVGPYRTIAKEGHSFRVQLPASWKIHPVFSPDRLRKDPDNPLPKQANPEPPAEEVNGELEWEIEKVLEARLYCNRLQYKVQWEGWDTDEEWYLAANFRNAPLILERFHTEHPELPGPPRRLATWLDDAAHDRFSEEHPEDNMVTNQGRDNRRRRRN